MKFENALVEYALGELVYSKFRNMTYKKKVEISDGVHPTNDFRYRQEFIERKI